MSTNADNPEGSFSSYETTTMFVLSDYDRYEISYVKMLLSLNAIVYQPIYYESAPHISREAQ